ncbi:MAG: hypothetical protein JMM75_02750 [Candidatus Xiphinematobacter sp.]|nr:MAG: hypothetical protein JMM75_02750 [Candidatus Xiphinematobacter sp.]
MTLDPKIPGGPLEEKWALFKDTTELISPANKRKLKILVVGSGLAGASAAATLGHWWIQQYFLPFNKCEGLQCDRYIQGLQAGRLVC